MSQPAVQVPPTNSAEYWDRRFEQDWQEKGGQEQSRFFYHLALDHMPKWLVRLIRTERLTICDWGCATGEGADLLAHHLNAQVTGIDFSEAAIAEAKSRFKKPSFRAVDLLQESIEERYDVVLSSNTLEHFSDPWGVLESISTYAQQALVILIPYREYDRHFEHEYSFDEKNIPALVAGEFHLVFSQVIDTGGLKPSYWPGEQILLVYAKPQLIDRVSLSLEDLPLEHAEQAERTALEEQLATAVAASKAAQDELKASYERAQDELKASYERAQDELKASNERADADRHKLEQLDALVLRLQSVNSELTTNFSNKITFLNEAVQKKDKLLAKSEAELRKAATRLKQLDTQLRTVQVSHSWRVTAPLRSFTIAARRAMRAAKGGSWKVARRIYRGLPLPSPIKTKLRERVLGPLPPQPEVKAKQRSRGLPASVTAAATSPLLSQRLGEGTPMLPPLTRAPEPADVFVWGIIDWHFRIQRPQHIARGFANHGHRVFYFSNNFVNDAQPGFRIEPISDDGLLNVVYLHVAGAPSIYFGAASAETEAAILASLGAFLRQAAPRSILSLVQHPFWLPFADKVPNRQLVYDLMDHHEGFGDNAPDILALEKRALKTADHVIVTSTFLEEVARAKNSSVSVVRNAAEYEHFARRPDNVFTDPAGRRIIGYYGAIAGWFDVDLVEQIAQRFPSELILLIGADSAGVEERLKAYPNVKFTGEVKYAELPYYLYAFDVCLMPFKVIPLTLATNPVKVYEYLSAGKPVVCVDLPEIAQFGGLVATARGYDQFIAHVENLLQNPGGDQAVAARRKFASEQTWDHRIASMIRSLAATPQPRISIIVVTYNKLELTHACLTSLEQNTHYKNVEIIVVDNASTDETPHYLQSWAKRGKHRIVIQNEKNLGFAAANNQGLKRATGAYLVLLNNDTYVTPGWVGTLVTHLRRDPDLGIIGPVTNNIGNEARIDISYGPMEEMQHVALAYTSSHLGKMFPLRTAAFFCVAMTRKAYEQVGDLDESFGIGMFEDDDYCRRIQLIGMHVACAEDVFVHHYHSASFNEMNSAHRKALFDSNKRIYEEKWGAWVPHTYRVRS
ncbi:glycosyltransferase [Microvirga sp. Mcv34]|uniref:glycosyltransferase n=1 Tax=Microvirga sp. Mcv34 TaxID=2926016 RepID=UPI0021C887B5|nr:glycosyltransferase [Microvirga sp. Mcv34]